MKRIIFIFLVAMMSTAVCSAAMSNSKVRKELSLIHISEPTRPY